MTDKTYTAEQVDGELVALHHRAWNIEMTRQQRAGEPVNHIKATRAALSWVLPAYAATLRQPSADSGRVGDEVVERYKVLHEEGMALYNAKEYSCGRVPQLHDSIDAGIKHALAALAAQGQGEAVAAERSILDGLDFEPDESHTVADMANVGYSLMEAIGRNMPGYAYNYSPAEIVVDLINERDEALATHPAPAASPAELAAEYTRGRSDGWEAAKAASPAGVPDDYLKIARLIGRIFFYGEFQAETYNERELEKLLRKTGNFYETEEQLLAAAAPSAKPEGDGGAG